MTTKKGEEVCPALKPTSFMTNSPCVADELNSRCENYGKPKEQWHKHISLTNGRAKAAQVYPKELCRAFCRGISKQKKLDEASLFMIGSLETTSGEAAIEELQEAQKTSKKAHEQDSEDNFDHYQLHNHANLNSSSNGKIAYDDVTGTPLDVEMVIEARKAEIAYFRRMQ
eukprot:2115598-Karenia_brevis.AAC.1